MGVIDVNLIAAVASNGVIGYRNRIPWHLPNYNALLERDTRHAVCIVGRHTYEYLPPMPHRTLFVLGRGGVDQVVYDASGTRRTVQNLSTDLALAEVLELAKSYQCDHNRRVKPAKRQQRVFVLGGAQLYAQALEADLIDTMRLTHVQIAPQGDRWFPRFDLQRWGLHVSSHGEAYASVSAATRVVYHRRRSGE